MNLFNIILLLVLLPIGESHWTGTLTDISISPRSDSTGVTRTVARFHDAIQRGDTAAVRQLIASDIRVLEGGDVEDRAQYLAHHLAEDIEFAKGVRGETKVVSYAQQGSVAWVVSTSTSVGKFKGRDVDSVGTELMVLSRTKGIWKIRAIHWSSRRR
ncbi:MAG: YybH family protein [Gemmatimonadaceae bacterium]